MSKAKALNLLTDIIAKAKAQGADAADAVLFESANLTVRQRMHKPETLERAESLGLGVRLFVAENIKAGGGFRQAMISGNDISSGSVATMIERGIAMAKAAPVDPYAALAGEEMLTTRFRKLDIFDKEEPTPEKLLSMAGEAEAAALAQPGITNSEGADAGYHSSQIYLATSNGFVSTYRSSSVSVSVSIIAGLADKMETDYDYSVAHHLADIKSPSLIGKLAADRALRKLGPRKVKTAQVPIIFDARTARGLLGSLASAVNGAAIARGTSFLNGKMGDTIFSEGVNVIDDPFRKRGLGSRPFDGEGISGRKMNIIEDGILTSWLLDVRSAKQLGLKTTGHASRGIGAPPSPSSTNFYMEKGRCRPSDLMSDITNGLYVTEAFGMGVNGVTGDYSQGAAGFWIENGELSFPVSEVTIAGNLLDMFKNLTPADDLEFISSVNAPTVRIEGMTVAGL